MTLRERIADWISGGELTWLKRQNDAWYRIAIDAQKRRDDVLEAQANRNIAVAYDNRNGWANSDRFKAALTAIAACETPSANATVRRMANIAREALK